jgi:cytosine/adenosine deaminase-related metal-dependent hydrolase
VNDRRSKVVRNGRVLRAVSLSAAPLDLLIEDGRIRDIGAPGMPAPADAEIIDAHDRLVIPGLVNSHTHAHGGLGKGAVSDRLPLEVFLTGSGALNGSRTLEDKYLSAQLSAVDMVRKGCTAAYDLFVEYPVPPAPAADCRWLAYWGGGAAYSATQCSSRRREKPRPARATLRSASVLGSGTGEPTQPWRRGR